MQPGNNLTSHIDDEKQLTEQHQKRSQALTRKHNKELLNSEKNNESSIFKAKMHLRHGTEFISLSQLYFNLWLDLIERQKVSLAKLR
jgi:hypothetical protein